MTEDQGDPAESDENANATSDRSERSVPFYAVVGQFGWYFGALLVPAFTVVPALVEVAVPALPQSFVYYQFGFAGLLAVGLVLLPRAPSAFGVFLASILAALAAPVLGILTLGPGAEEVTGSLPVLAEVSLTWVAAYGLAGYVSIVLGPLLGDWLRKIDARYGDWAVRRQRRHRDRR